MMEKLSTLLDTDERGVSPVIGVILMVAITVILAAVIGTFVLGLGSNTQSSPQASITISDNNQDWTGTAASKAFDLDHDSGDSIKFDDLRIVVRNADNNQVAATLDAGSYSAAGSGNAVINGNTAVTGGIELSVGDVLTLSNGGLTDEQKYEITVIHKPSSQTVASSTIQLS